MSSQMLLNDIDKQANEYTEQLITEFNLKFPIYIDSIKKSMPSNSQADSNFNFNG